ncbi:MAG TPA: hypothetical protein VNT51_01945, partial [Miltoncostaeaceae bacterium]|nr:hypothetical protein [Miltoncostaeaceae bacterium]
GGIDPERLSPLDREDPMSQPDPRVALLRAAGEDRAAELLAALDRLDPQPAEVQSAQPEPTPHEVVDQRLRAEGEALLAALHEGTGNRWRS